MGRLLIPARARALFLAVAMLPFYAWPVTLYNNIEIPEQWPPNRPPSRDPMPVPYLEKPPSVIPIDCGRQLFVDDFLIESTSLTRMYHKAEYYPNNPVLAPDTAWDKEGDSQGSPAPTAMVFSDGVWFDPKDNLFKMWYMSGFVKATAYAVSQDGIHWEKPALDVTPGTNIVHTAERDSGTVWLDQFEKDPARRFKMFLYRLGADTGKLTVYFSPDGVHWGEQAAVSGPLGDRSTVFYNPFRSVWVYGIRDYVKDCGRIRLYSENADVLEAAKWRKGEAPFWVGADKLDPMRPDLNTPCELYNLDAVAYESLMLGLFSIWRGQPDDRAKPNEICVGFSRDGFHWQRPMREAFIPVSEKYGDWNWGNIQSAGGCCLVVKDKLYFYVSGRSGVKGSPASGTSSTGLAILRRDGFASMDAGDKDGTLTTRPVLAKGNFLFMNADAAKGEISAEVLDQDGNVLRAKEDCAPVKIDGTCVAVRWSKGQDIANRPIKIRFHVKNARLYAFWVSQDEQGHSGGYVAAGGPGFTGPADRAM
jgi:hypothetical protein